MRRPASPLALLPLAALALLALGTGPCETPFPAAVAAKVTLDPATQYQTIEGLGGSAANEATLRAMPEPDRSQVLDLVFGDLEPSVVRFTIPHSIEGVNDDADPDHLNAAGFVSPDAHLWQLAEIALRGSPKLMAAPWSPPAWMKTTGQTCCGGSLLPGMEPELAEFFSAYLGFLEQAGHPLDWLSLQNEPEAASPWDANNYTPAGYAAAAEVVAQRLVRDGHASRLAGPDTALRLFPYLFFPGLLAQPSAGPLTDGIAFHLYEQGYYDVDRVALAVSDLRSRVPAQLPIWMTEYSNTTGVGYGSYDEGFAQAELIHGTFVNGGGMYVVWNLYRPGGPGEALVVISPTHGAAGYTVTPKYWTARQFTKYVRPGARRIAATSADAQLAVSAYRNLDGSTVAVFLNRSLEPRWAVVEGGALDAPPRFVRTSPSENGVELPNDSTDRLGARMLRLPGRSVATAVWPGP
jgi:glucosylceramidase